LSSSRCWGFVYLFAKTFVVYFFTILFRGSLPRFRMDQMLNLNWKVLTPAGADAVFATALVDKLCVTLVAENCWLRARFCWWST
jgi:NADH:ubiquinone oxidoreductase subunit H